jgi:phosphate transport system substrate-binding protein
MLTFIRRTAAVAAVVLSCGVAASAAVRLVGSGATFPEPLYKRWIGEFEKAKGIQVDYTGIGSGGGIKDITSKTVAFAGSDAPMNKAEVEKFGGAGNLVEVPSVAGGVVPAYNLPGVSGTLNFTGEVLADIFMGKISAWNDPKIAALNAGVKLPGTPITPAWRTDGSGTTFVWTSYLTTQSPEFKDAIGASKQVEWPTGQGGKGNPGVAAIVQQTPGAIGYVELNYAEQNKITFGAVKNKDGKFVKASAASISAAGAGAAEKMSGSVVTADIWNQPGADSYPISSFTYLIVYKDLNNVASMEHAKALADFLSWATHDGQKFAGEMGYAPLAPPVQAKVEAALGMLTYKGQPVKK